TAERTQELTARWTKRCNRWRKENAQPCSAKPATQGEEERSTPNAQGRTEEATVPQPSTINPQLLFGIVQGGTFHDLRRESAQAIVELDFDGYAIGGVSVGESEEEMMRAVESAEPYLPTGRPRYPMVLGTPPELLELVARGMDMFDCVLPTRLARNGTAFTTTGTLNLKNAEFTLDKRPIEENCACPACREFTRGYIRHLIKAEEIL